MPADGSAESMIVSVQRFGEYRVLNSDIYSRKFQSVSICTSIVYVSVDRHIFIQSPTCRTVVYHDIPDCISAYRIITKGNILCTTTETHMTDNNIVCINQKRLSCHTYAVSRSRLSGNGHIRCTYTDRTLEMYYARYIENDNTCPPRFTSFTECSGTGIFERCDYDYFPSTTTGSIHSPSLRTGKSGDITFYQIFRF